MSPLCKISNKHTASLFDCDFKTEKTPERIESTQERRAKTLI